MSLRSPLREVKGLGSAKTGTEHFISQRISAVALVFLGLWFAFSIASIAGGSYAEIKTWLAMPFNSLVMILFVATAFYHAQLGLTTVIEDYVASHGKRMITLIVVKYALIVLGVASVLALLRISLGAA